MRKYVALYFTLLIFSNLINAQNNGIPFLQAYLPAHYHGESQVWAINQDNKGIMYFGLTLGLHTYNGSEWKKIPINNLNVIRSLFFASNNIMYVGCDNQFGYLKTKDNGQIEFISLMPAINEQNRSFTDIWSITQLKNSIYFSSREYIFSYNVTNGKIKTITADSTIRKQFNINNKAYATVTGKGLYQLSNDSLYLLKDYKQLNNFFIWEALPANHSNTFLAISRTQGVQILNPHTQNPDSLFITDSYFTKQQISELNQTIITNDVYNAIRLKNGNMAMASVSGGVFIINKNGEVAFHLTEKEGIPSETNYCVFEDNQGGVWTGSENGIMRIDLNLPVTRWNQISGIKGSPYKIVRNNSDLYCATNLGLFRLQGNKFETITGLSSASTQCFDVKSYKIPGQPLNQLFTTTGENIFQILGNAIINTIPTNTYEIYQSRFNNAVLYYTDGYNLITNKLVNNKWTNAKQIASFEAEPFGFCEQDENNIWGILYDKPFKVALHKNNNIHFFTSNSEIESIVFWDIEYFNNTMYFLTNKGIFTYNQQTNYFNQAENLFNSSGTFANLKIEQASIYNNKQFAFLATKNNENLIYLVKEQNNKFTIDSTVFKINNAFDYVYTDGDSVIWFLNAEEVYKYNIFEKSEYEIKSKILVSKVIIGNDSILIAGPYANYENKNSKNNPYILSYKNNTITINFSLPYFSNEKQTQYAVLIDNGQKNPKWSEWTNIGKKELLNLREGNYTIKIKAKSVFGYQSEILTLHFKILPPWYRTTIAYITYVILFWALFLILVKLYTRQLRNDKQRLEKLVEKRTKEINEKNGLLQKQFSEITEKNQALLQYQEEILAQAENLTEANEQITAKNNELTYQKQEIEKQADSLKIVNKELINKNIEILQQREELKTSTENLQKFYNQIQTANEQIIGKNKKITDSIQYALRIQSALLPQLSEMEQCLNQCFVLFKPRDIVSGDFYWFRNFTINNQNFCLLAVADCTGHGVPGAFMSLLGISLLNELVNKNEITNPATMLSGLRDRIKTLLNQTGKTFESKDGMDMAFCEFNLTKKTIKYAGANLPLYYFKSEDNQHRLIEYKPDRMPIGIYINEREQFTEFDIAYNSNDTIILSTDGYMDQRGGTKTRKLMTRNFKELLTSVQHASMIEQKNMLETYMYNWMTTPEGLQTNQIDDILIIGIRLL